MQTLLLQVWQLWVMLTCASWPYIHADIKPTFCTWMQKNESKTSLRQSRKTLQCCFIPKLYPERSLIQTNSVCSKLKKICCLKQSPAVMLPPHWLLMIRTGFVGWSSLNKLTITTFYQLNNGHVFSSSGRPARVQHTTARCETWGRNLFSLT